MALGDLFKSPRERERDKAKKRRKAFRDAERSVETVKDRIGKLKGERDTKWKEARQYLGDGQKAASMRSLKSCRACEVLMSKLEMKRWVFEQLLTKLELAKTDQDFAVALRAIDAVVDIDPEEVDDVLSEVDAKLADQADTDKIWEREFKREMEGVETKMTDTIPTIEELEKQLEDEVAVDVVKSRAPEKEKAAPAPDRAIAEEIGEARKRLRKLMEEGNDE